MKRLIEANRSVVVSADVTTQTELASLMDAVCSLEGIGAIKLGMTFGLKALDAAVSIVKGRCHPHSGHPSPKIIFDYQKAANDIPPMGVKFAKICKTAGVDAVILFPFAGPVTQRQWTEACQEEGLEVLVGGIMTHPEFLVSEGGYVADDAPERIFRLACEQGVRNFVVPGTKLEWVKLLRGLLVDVLGDGTFALFAPGLITQGGDISECGRAAGSRFHAIVGSGIYEADVSKGEIGSVENMRAAAEAAVQALAQ